ncbi:hypothetical protein C0989_011785 [Termitomyces sp. Mn162]|nr:hypothetical protein C0989_011785 [Termitomyces sp. Mn162]
MTLTTSNTPAITSPSNSVPTPAAKPADKGKASEQSVTSKHPPVAKETITQLPVHLFSSIPGANANAVQDPSNILEEALLTFTMDKPQFFLGSNVATAKGLTPDQAQDASINPVKAYIDLLPPEEEPMVLTVTKNSQSL